MNAVLKKFVMNSSYKYVININHMDVTFFRFIFNTLFLYKAFTIYEESISESRAQFQAITLIIGTLQTIRVFGSENYDTLITKCALHGSKLLKKPDQCRAVYLSSHLWWATEVEGRETKSSEVVYIGSFNNIYMCILLNCFTYFTRNYSAKVRGFLNAYKKHSRSQILVWIPLQM
jgi:hypothetical protein